MINKTTKKAQKDSEEKKIVKTKQYSKQKAVCDLVPMSLEFSLGIDKKYYWNIALNEKQLDLYK